MLNINVSKNISTDIRFFFLQIEFVTSVQYNDIGTFFKLASAEVSCAATNVVISAGSAVSGAGAAIDTVTSTITKITAKAEQNRKMCSKR